MRRFPSDGYTKRFYLRPEDREQIVRLSQCLNVSQSRLIRDAVDWYENFVREGGGASTKKVNEEQKELV
jgi:hypothetical protein